MVEKCVRCGVREDQIKLFDTIYEGKANCICERCSIIENVSILERPDSDKIKESNRVIDVYERMRRLTGMAPEKKESEERKKRLEELNKNPQLEIPQKKTIELVDHFHWEIMKCRRRKGLSHNQLGELIGEPGFSIEMIEKGNLGENAETLIKKLENFFNIKLVKLNSFDLMKKNERNTPVLLDEDGNVLETIPEPAFKMREEDLFLDEDMDEEFDEVEEKKENNRFFNNFITKLKEKTSNFSASEDEEERASSSNFDDKDSSNEAESILWNETASSSYSENSDFAGEENEEIEDFNLDKIDKNEVKIGDLKELHKRKIESTRTERFEEQRRIEDRQKLIEARREELRMIKEKDSKDIDNLLGGAELLKKEVLNGFEKS